MDNLEALLVLNSILDPKPVYQLIEYFGSTSQILHAKENEMYASGLLHSLQIKKIGQWTQFFNLENELKRIDKSKTNLIPFWSSDYPQVLANIPNAPLILYHRGKYLPSHEGGVAMVGTRGASLYGRKMTQKFATDFATYDIEVISGMARGIDWSAHEGAMQIESGKTFAILGCGLGYLFDSNQVLVDQIIDHGAVISEFPWDRHPSRYSFPRRNRIISGLSKVVCVMEAGFKSGAMITAEYALEQGKPIYVMPGQIDSSRSRGCHALIKDGAYLLDQISDVLKEFNRQEIGEAVNNNSVGLEGLEKTIWTLLDGENLSIDEISVETGQSLSHLYTVLLNLELRGIIVQQPGKVFMRSHV